MRALHRTLWKRHGPFHKYQLSGQKHPQYKEFVPYRTIHLWLVRKFGKASKCENKKCNGKSKYYLYALIKGKKHERCRENYKMLCMSCHVKYDMTQEWKDKITRTLTYNHGT